jgi:hypothetical protein
MNWMVPGACQGLNSNQPLEAILDYYTLPPVKGIPKSMISKTGAFPA